MATAYPTLAHVGIENFNEEPAYDPTISTRSQAGYLKTRSATNRTSIPMKYTFNHAAITSAEKETMITFQNTVKVGGDTVTWTHPDGTSKTVRMTAPLKFTPIIPELITIPHAGTYWKVDVQLEEV